MLDINLGQAGEVVAKKFLELTQFEILTCNYKCQIGEIDIIARRKNVLHFIEVKTRGSTDYGWPSEAVTPTKQRKLRLLAMYYLSTHPYAGPITFGVVEVLHDALDRRYQVQLIADAF